MLNFTADHKVWDVYQLTIIHQSARKIIKLSLGRTATAKYLRAAPARRDVILLYDCALRDAILLLAVGTPSRCVLVCNFSSLCDACSPRRIQFRLKLILEAMNNDLKKIRYSIEHKIC